MSDVLKMYIGGKWVLSSSGKTRDLINPSNGEVIAVVTDGNEQDANQAVEAARKAFYDDSAWRGMPALQRAKLLYAVADGLEKRVDEIGRLETLNNGKPLREGLGAVTGAANCLRYFAGLITKPHGQVMEVPNPNIHAMTTREPVGVCALIVPWNFPLSLAMWKLAPALAAGNTVVLKPSSIMSLTAIKLFEVMDEVGFPEGVINLLLGSGSTAGNALISHRHVDKVSFTGGKEAGQEIMTAAVRDIKNITLELGGKSPNIVFADADFDTAVDYALYGIFLNQGEVCSAGSRLLLQEDIYDKFLAELIERTKKIKVGPGIEPGVEMGPLVTRDHLENVLEYVQIGLKEGATLVYGGKRIMEGELKKGYFMEPTIFVDVTEDMRIVKEEIFGPVLVVQKFKDEADAVRIANNTDYGLAAGVFTNDCAKAMRVAKELRAGTVWINTFNLCLVQSPWGGYKQSGMGRDLGTYGYEDFTEVKAITVNLNVTPTGWYSA
jgi:betaine-aldehyde dehydrogenase